jgi:hypothetical protein
MEMFVPVLAVASCPSLSLSRLPSAVVRSMTGILMMGGLVLSLFKMGGVLALLNDRLRLLLGLLLGRDLFGWSIEKHIDHHVPRLVSGDRSTEIQNLSGEQPVNESDGFGGAVVARNDNVNVLNRGIRVAESNGGEIHIRSLSDSLVVSSGVSDEEETGLNELLLDLIGEGSRRVSSSDGLRSGEVGELQSCSLSDDGSRNNAHFRGVIDSGDDSRRKNELLPGFGNVDQMDAIGSAPPDVPVHVGIDIGGSDMSSDCQELLDVFFFGLKGRG